MALNIDVYKEILEKESVWINSINLLNSIYCNLELKPFYEKKRTEIIEEYNKSNNVILGEFIKIIDKIIGKIESFNEQYNNSLNVDMKSLLPYLFTYQLNNSLDNNQLNSNDNLNELEKLEIKKQVIQSEINDYRNNQDDSDVIIDDFDEEVKPLKR